MLRNNQLFEELNLHNSVSSLEQLGILREDMDIIDIENSPYYNSQKSQYGYFSTLKIANWSYSTIITSAAYCVLENIYITNEKKFLQSQHKSFQMNISIFCETISVYLLNSNFSNEMFSAVHSTNIFYKETVACVNGYLRFFEKKNQYENKNFLKKEKNSLNFLE